MEIGSIIIFFLINGTIWGAISEHVAKSKGQNNGFAWGFWLGLIGLMVVGLKPTLNQTSEVLTNDAVEETSSHSVELKNSFDALERLHSLHERGILTDEEYAQKKAKILENM